jgi:hypothetical protein
MANDSRDSMIRLGKAAVAVQRGAEISRFEVHTASLSLAPGHRSVHLWLEGGSGSVISWVVSDAICWAPAYWRAPVDDVLEIARMGRHLLCDPLAPGDGYRALLAHNADGLVAWKAFLAT